MFRKERFWRDARIAAVVLPAGAGIPLRFAGALLALAGGF